MVYALPDIAFLSRMKNVFYAKLKRAYHEKGRAKGKRNIKCNIFRSLIFFRERNDCGCFFVAISFFSGGRR